MKSISFTVIFSRPILLGNGLRTERNDQALLSQLLKFDGDKSYVHLGVFFDSNLRNVLFLS